MVAPTTSLPAATPATGRADQSRDHQPLCRRLDRRLQAMAGELGFVYTRYADDLTFSAASEDVGQAAEVLRRLHRIVGHEGFNVHPDKTRVLRRGGGKRSRA